MIPMSLTEIADVVGGDVHGDGEVVVTGPAYVDSRSPVAAGLFVAIVGERVDGHEFAAGAHAVLGSRPTAVPTVVVDDPVVALGRLARHVLARVPATVLALTGSQGKTGTKDYLASVLARLAGAERVVATEGNGNNEIGVPLTVLRAGVSTDYLVVEMGARGIGHVAYLCEIAPPGVAAVLNVGTAHVGEFGGREQIALAKGEIVEALPADGVAVLNADDPLVAAMAPRSGGRVLTFGRSGDVRWDAVTLDDTGRPEFTLAHGDAPGFVVRLQQTGAHQVPNAAAAAAMAVAAGFPLADVADALSLAAAASPWRMEVHERADGLVVVNDAYNANPDSVRAALEALVVIGRARGRRTVAVLGEMRELGAEHDAGHRAVGADAARLGVDVVVVVGSAAAPIAAAIGPHDGPVVVSVETRDEALLWVRQNAGPGDVVLVKASRGVALERVAEQLLGDLP